MALENILSQEIVQQLGWTLLHFIWQATAVALLAAVLLAGLRKAAPNVRYIIACTALGLIVLLPAATIVLVPVSPPQPIANTEAPPPPAVAPVQATEETPLAGAVESQEPVQPQSINAAPETSWRQRVVERLEPALPHLVTGWVIGVFGLSLWHLGGWAQLQRLRRKLIKPVDAALHAVMKQLADKLGVDWAVELLESALVQVPTVVGWLRPVILLPAAALTGLSTDQLEALLAHELAHIRRCDYLVNMFQMVVETLGFYHPAVWWVSHKIRIERENCCDDLAVGLCGDRVRYARALTSMEEIRSGRSEFAMAASGGNLFARVHRLLGKDTTDSTRAGWLPSVITILLIAMIAIPTTLALTAKSKPQEPQAAIEPQEPEPDTLPAGWSLDYDDGVMPDGGTSWPANMARDLASLRIMLKPYDPFKSSLKGERYEFDILSVESKRIGYVRVEPESELGRILPDDQTLKPGKYLLRYTRRRGTPEDNLRIECGEFPVNLSKPGMYRFQFTPQLGTAEIAGDLGGCYAINFERVGKGFWVRGFGYQSAGKRYLLDGLPPGTYKLSAVTQRQSDNVFVRRAEVTVSTAEKATVNIDSPARGNCSLKGTIQGRHKTYQPLGSTSSGSEGRWFVRIGKLGSGPIGRTEAYEALTMDSLYVVRGRNIVQEAEDQALYSIEGLVAGEYTVTAIEHPWRGGLPVTRQQSKTLVLKDSEQATLDFDLSDIPEDDTPPAPQAESLIDNGSSTDSRQEQTPNPNVPVVAESRETEVFGRVLQDGRNVIGARVIARIRRDHASQLSSRPPEFVKTSDENGLYRFADVPAGRYSISVMSPKGNLNMAQKQINLEPGGRAELNFGDEDGFTLSGVVTVNGEAVEIASVMIQLPNESVKWGWTDHDGNFRITGIPRGRHQLFTMYDKDLDPVTFLWGKDGKQVYDALVDRRQITIENDRSVDMRLEDRSKKESPAVTSKLTSDKACTVKVELSVVEVFPDLKMDRETMIVAENVLGIRIRARDSRAVADLLRQACEATAAGKDESAGDKRVTQEQFDTLLDKLVSRGYLKILFRPTLLVVEGQTAQLKSKQKIPSTQETLEDSIEITPTVSKDGSIILHVEATLYQRSISPSNEKTPIINKLEISTQLRLSPGESGIIGGTMHPVLRSEPAGDAKSSQAPANELMCILTASITTPPADTKPQDGAVVDVTSGARGDMPATNGVASVKAEKLKEAGSGRAVVFIEMQVLSVSKSFLEKAAANTDSANGAEIWSKIRAEPTGSPLSTPGQILDEAQVQSILKAIGSDKGSRVFFKPQVLAQEGKQERIDIDIGRVASFTLMPPNKPNAPSEESVPKTEWSQRGICIRLLPELREDKKDIRLECGLEIRRALIPKETESTPNSKDSVPGMETVTGIIRQSISDGATLLLDGGRSPFGARLQDYNRLIILVKPTVCSQEQMKALGPPENEYEGILLSHIDANEAAERITKVLSQLPDKEFWPSVPIQPLDGGRQVIIFGRPDVRAKIKELLAEIDVESLKSEEQRGFSVGKPSEGAHLPPAEAAVYGQLETAVVDLSALRPTLSFREALNVISKSVDPPLEIKVNWPDVRSARIDGDTKIGMDGASAVLLGAGLENLLKAVAGGSAELNYVVDEGTITIATLRSLPDKLMPRVYDISDLVTTSAEAEALTRRIMETVEPNSWHDLNETGNGTTIAYPVGEPKELAILQSRKIHKKIERLLEDLRRDRAEQEKPKSRIRIETRILEVTDDFLRENQLDVNSVRTGKIPSAFPIAESAAEPNSPAYCLIFDDLDVSKLFQATAAPGAEGTRVTWLPKVFASDGRLVRMTIGSERLPVLISSDPTDPSGETGFKLDYEDVDTVIKITPGALPDGNNVLLDLELDIPQVRGFEQQAGFDGKQHKVPVIARDIIKTTATVPDGKMLLIGGKRTPHWDVTIRKEPLPGDLPLIGSLFLSESRGENARNILILIKPTAIAAAAER